jgi:CheY-like chemotaxis protein
MNNPLHILIVDDDPMMAKTLADILRLIGYDVEIAHSGTEALEKIEQASPDNEHSSLPLFDCVISDIKMPEMNGVELCHYIKQRIPYLPVLLMTAYSEDNLIRKGMDEGVVDVLTKPFNIDKLLVFLDHLEEKEGRSRHHDTQ